MASTRLIRLSTLSSAEVAKAVELVAAPAVMNGKIVAVPTDTIYGLACLAQSTTAVRALYDIKGRDLAKPVAICVSDVRDIAAYANTMSVPSVLMNALLPGPVTVVLERSAALNPELNAQTNLIGVRVPDHPLIRQLVGCCAQPLALTSANRSSEQSPVAIDEFKGLWDELECILDGGTITGTAEQRKGSTVVDLSVAGHYRIIREGVRYADTLAILLEHNLVELPS